MSELANSLLIPVWRMATAYAAFGLGHALPIGGDAAGVDPQRAGLR